MNTTSKLACDCTSHPVQPERLQALAASLREHGVPPDLAVPLLLRMSGVTVPEFARSVRLTDTYLYMILHGKRPPTERVRSALAARLGFDPLMQTA